jgi:hypothetical protein
MTIDDAVRRQWLWQMMGLVVSRVGSDRVFLGHTGALLEVLDCVSSEKHQRHQRVGITI